MKIFKSDQYFILFDYHPSHGQLLLRAVKNDVGNKNIDIIFFGVKYIQLHTSLHGVSIKAMDSYVVSLNYDSLDLFLNDQANHLFELESKGEKFYIAAAYFKIYENELEFNETSLGFSELGKEKEII